MPIELRCPFCHRSCETLLYLQQVEKEWLAPLGITSAAGALGWLYGQQDRLEVALAEERKRVAELERRLEAITDA